MLLSRTKKMHRMFIAVTSGNNDVQFLSLDCELFPVEVDAIKELKICQLEQPGSAIKISRIVERTKRERIRKRTSEQE